ncbi:MAG TPA: lipase family protein, partial [Acidimicrobiales bacterium]|nr:lipase family protein [Acidimicrobiales bacterium]
RLVGVAAGGPVPNLIDLFKVNIKTTVGRVLIAMALQSWAKVYHDANLDQIVTPGARPIVAKIAKTCLYSTTQALGSLPSAVLLGFTFLSTPPWEVEPWRTIATDNTPGGASIHAPLTIFQGGADTIVAPAVTRQLGTALCAKGETLTLRVLPGVGHVETGHDAVPEVRQWIADRFAGKPAPSTCT